MHKGTDADDHGRPSQQGFFVDKPTETKEDYTNTLGNLSLQWKQAVLSIFDIDEASVHVTSFNNLIAGKTGSESRYEIWDTTCHIQAELAGIEKNNIFTMDRSILQSLCRDALRKAQVDMKIKADLPDNFLLGGVAVWNLVLPRKDGGVFPDEQYDEFLTHMHHILSQYKIYNGATRVGTPEQMKQAFLDFKQFALVFQTMNPAMKTKILEIMQYDAPKPKK